MIDNIYMYVSSTDSKDTYPNNHAYDFRVKLQSTISLSGCWQIALLSLHIPKGREYSGNPIYILCDKVVSSFAGETKLPVLRRLERLGDVIHQPYYVTLQNTGEISDVSFSILDAVTFNQVSFQTESVSYTLHLRKHNHFNI